MSLPRAAGGSGVGVCWPGAGCGADPRPGAGEAVWRPLSLLPGRGEGLRAKGRPGAAASRAVLLLRPPGLSGRVGTGVFRTGGLKSVSALEVPTPSRREGTGQKTLLLDFKNLAS